MRNTGLEGEYRRLLLEETDGIDRPSLEDLKAYLPGVSGDFLDRFKEAANSRTYGYEQVLDRIADEIEDYLPEEAEAHSRQGLALDMSCRVGVFEYPVGPFNAQTRRFSRFQYLVLVNTGVLTLLHFAVKIMIASTRIGPDGLVDRDDPIDGLYGRTPPQALAEVIAAFLGRGSRRSGAIPDLTGDDETRMDEVFYGAVKFIVAHEYAHALANLFRGDGSARDIHNGDPAQEGAADFLGFKLLLGKWRYGTFEDTAEEIRLQSLLAGPLLFFALQRIVTAAQRTYRLQPPNLEPEYAQIPLPEARALLLGQLYVGLWPRGRALTFEYEAWMDRQAEPTMQYLGTLVG